MKESYTLKLEGKEWKYCLKEAFEKKRKDIKMDGFRKGQVPYDIYVKKAGVETLYMDAVDMAVDMLYAKLLSDPKTITPAATPAIDIKDIGNDHIEVEFTLVESPKVELGKYKKLGIPYPCENINEMDKNLCDILFKDFMNIYNENVK